MSKSISLYTMDFLSGSAETKEGNPVYCSIFLISLRGFCEHLSGYLVLEDEVQFVELKEDTLVYRKEHRLLQKPIPASLLKN